MTKTLKCVQCGQVLDIDHYTSMCRACYTQMYAGFNADIYLQKMIERMATTALDATKKRLKQLKAEMPTEK